MSLLHSSFDFSPSFETSFILGELIGGVAERERCTPTGEFALIINL
jgi:hypothetical protein